MNCHRTDKKLKIKENLIFSRLRKLLLCLIFTDNILCTYYYSYFVLEKSGNDLQMRVYTLNICARNTVL